jgi:hypothetical protein
VALHIAARGVLPLTDPARPRNVVGMSSPNPSRSPASPYRWFSIFGLVVGLAMVGGSGLLIVTSVRALLAMPSVPTPCALAACASHAGPSSWVRIEGAALACERALGMEAGPYLYVPIVAREGDGPAMLAAFDDRPCEAEMPLVGSLFEAAPQLVARMRETSPSLGGTAYVLWTGKGPGDHESLIAVMAFFGLVGVGCVIFYARRLKEDPPLKAG